VEREDRSGDAVVLGDQAGLAVDPALQEPQAGFPAGDAGVEAGDLLGASDLVQRGGGQAAAVGGHGGAGVEQADEGARCPWLPRPA
jgi:hypothetical protein